MFQRFAVKVIIVLSLVFAVNSTSAQAEFRVNATVENFQGNPDIATNSDGSFVTTWVGGVGPEGRDFDVFAQRFGTTGSPVGSEFRINTQTSGNQVSPAVATDANGSFVVVWEGKTFSEATQTVRNIVCGQRFNANGLPQGSEFRISTDTYQYGVFPDVAMDGAGNFTVVWMSQDGARGIFARRYNASGVPNSLDNRIVNTGYDSHIAMNQNGEAVLSWIYDSSVLDSTTGRRVYYRDVMARRFDANGAPVENDIRINENRSNSKFQTAVTVGQDGRFAVAWSSDAVLGSNIGQDGSSWGVYARLFDATSQAQTGEFRVNTYTQNQQSAPSLAMTNNGGLVASWMSYEQDGSLHGIYLQRYEPTGVALGNELLVNTTTLGEQTYPQVATDQNGNAVVIWSSNNPTVVYDIYAAVIANPGAPVANADAATFDEDTAGPINVLANDSDPNGDQLTITAITAPQHGTARISSSNLGTTGVYYTPIANYNGLDSFNYTISDGQGGTATATVNITINSVNDRPVTTNQLLYGTEDVPQDIALPASDADDTVLIYTISQPPTHGTISGTMPNIVYTPNANYYGPEVFYFKATDPSGAFSESSVIINIDAVRDPAVAVADSKTVDEDSDWTPINVLGNDQDVDGVGFNRWGITPVSQQGGSVRSNLDGTVSYKPAPNFNGVDTFSYTVQDGYGLRSTAIVTVTVAPINDAPISSTQSVTTNEDTATNITLSASDIDGDTLTYTIVTPPTKGTLSGSGANRVYTPNANFNGSDSFSFKANDGVTDSNTATVSINVAPMNDAPVAVNDATTTRKNTARLVAVLVNDTDVDGDTLAIASVTAGANGTVAISGTSVNFTPARNFIGNASFSYVVKDNKGGTATATVAVTVTR